MASRGPPPPRGGGRGPGGPPGGGRGPGGPPGAGRGRRPTLEERVATDMEFCRSRLGKLRERHAKRAELVAQAQREREEAAARYAQQLAAKLAAELDKQPEQQQQQRGRAASPQRPGKVPS